MENVKKQRVLLKISGEAFSGKNGFGYDPGSVEYLVSEIAEIADLCELGIVVGGGNLFRGSKQGKELGLNSTTVEEGEAHFVGMTATIMNAKILSAKLRERGIENRHQSALSLKELAEPFLQLRAVRHLEKGRVVVFSGGTGNAFSTTDTAMVQRALDIGASVVLKGTKVDGVYSGDPEHNTDAKFMAEISFDEYLRLGLKILDLTAVTKAKDNNLPIRVFNFFKKGNLKKVIEGENIGSIIR